MIFKTTPPFPQPTTSSLAALAWAATLAVLLVALPSSVDAASPGALPELRTERVSLEGPTSRWVISGVFHDRNVVLLDVLTSNLRSIDLKGGSRGAIDLRAAWPGDRRPSVIQAVGDQYVLEIDSAELAWLDENLQPSRRPVLNLAEKSARGAGEKLAALYNWVVTGRDGNTLFAYGDLQTPSGEWITRLVAVDLDDSSSFHVVPGVAQTQSIRPFYLLGNRYLAESPDGDGVYFLELSGGGGDLYRVHRTKPGVINTERVATVGSTFHEAASILQQVGWSDAARLYERLHQTELVTQLFSTQRFLYLLKSVPSGPGKGWTLQQLDPATGQRTREWRINSDAHQLLPVLGGDTVVFVEKGKVEALGEQHIPSMLVVSRSELER